MELIEDEGAKAVPFSGVIRRLKTKKALRCETQGLSSFGKP